MKPKNTGPNAGLNIMGAAYDRRLHPRLRRHHRHHRGRMGAAMTLTPADVLERAAYEDALGNRRTADMLRALVKERDKLDKTLTTAMQLAAMEMQENRT